MKAATIHFSTMQSSIQPVIQPACTNQKEKLQQTITKKNKIEREKKKKILYFPLVPLEIKRAKSSRVVTFTAHTQLLQNEDEKK